LWQTHLEEKQVADKEKVDGFMGRGNQDEKALFRCCLHHGVLAGTIEKESVKDVCDGRTEFMKVEIL